ncbi:flippase [Candidatus Gracilibacteria bacterium]|nr:flippase [Candidatus Gracilibacteria bacterium]
MASHTKVLSNAFAQFFGKIISIGASLAIVKIVTGFGTEFYGNYITAYEFLAFFGIIADGGLFAIAVREMSKKPEKSEYILGNIFSMRLGLILLVTLIAGISAQFVPTYAPVVKIGIWITGLSMALTIVAGTLSSILQARMKIQYFSGALALGKMLLAVCIYVISQHIGLFENVFFTMLWAGVLSNVFFCVLVSFFASREVSIRLGWDFSWWKKTLKMSLPYGLALILQTLYLRIDVVLISILLGASAVGIYGVATRILESFLILGVFFGQAILPRLSAQEGDHDKAQKTLGWGMEILLIFSIPIVIGSIIFAPQIIQLISTPEYLSSGVFLGSDKVLSLLVITVFFAYFNQLFTFTLVAKNRQNYLLFVNGFAFALNACLNILFLTRYGIIAAAISTILCEILVFGLLMKEIWKHFRIPLRVKNVGIILSANMILFSMIYSAHLQNNLILAVTSGVFVYFGILWIFKNQFFEKEK